MRFPWEYKHCTGTVQVHTGRCVLHAVVINDIAAADGVKVTVYDGVGVTANIIAVINIDAAKTHFVNPVTLLYDVQCETGLYVAFSAAEGDITVTFR